MSTPENSLPNFETLTIAEFEQILPDLFSNAGATKVSEDPRLKTFFSKYPDSVALVRDLETIAEHARSLFDPVEEMEPSDAVWSNIQSRLASGDVEPDA